MVPQLSALMIMENFLHNTNLLYTIHTNIPLTLLRILPKQKFQCKYTIVFDLRGRSFAFFEHYAKCYTNCFIAKKLPNRDHLWYIAILQHHPLLNLIYHRFARYTMFAVPC